MPDDIVCRRFAIAGHAGLPLRGAVRHRPAGAGDAMRPVIILHGFKGFMDWGFFPTVATEIARAGYLAVSFNFSGSGIGTDPETFSEVERFEHATLSGDLDDVAQILDALAAGGLPGPPAAGTAALLGHSRGGGVAIVQAAADPQRIGCLVTWAAVSSFARYPADERRRWRERGHTEVVNARTGQVFRLRTDVLDDLERNAVPGGRLDLERAARALRIPYLIVHGRDDESVPFSEATDLAGWAPPSSTVLEAIDDTGHTFGAVHPFAGRTPALDRALDATLGFLRRHLRHLPPA